MVPETGWCNPSTILFATECPANQATFAVALAQAKEWGAKLILFHVSEPPIESVPICPKATDNDCSPFRPAKLVCEPLVQRAKDLNVGCEVAIKNGSICQEILNYVHERHIDRVVMGARTAGPVGKLLIGSVAETLLRTADVPVSIIGPFIEEGTYHNPATRTILCAISGHRSDQVTVRFASELAVQKGAALILQQIIAPQYASEMLAVRTLRKIEQSILNLIPAESRKKLRVQVKAVIGDPAEELLYQGRVTQANLIIIGAYNATHFAAVSNSGVVYKVLAYARCPVIALSPAVLNVALKEYGTAGESLCAPEVNYLAGVV